jgi:hypothetical protein
MAKGTAQGVVHSRKGKADMLTSLSSYLYALYSAFPAQCKLYIKFQILFNSLFSTYFYLAFMVNF